MSCLCSLKTLTEWTDQSQNRMQILKKMHVKKTTITQRCVQIHLPILCPKSMSSFCQGKVYVFV